MRTVEFFGSVAIQFGGVVEYLIRGLLLPHLTNIFHGAHLFEITHVIQSARSLEQLLLLPDAWIPLEMLTEAHAFVVHGQLHSGRAAHSCVVIVPRFRAEKVLAYGILRLLLGVALVGCNLVLVKKTSL